MRYRTKKWVTSILLITHSIYMIPQEGILSIIPNGG